jgi:hypothetical protein
MPLDETARSKLLAKLTELLGAEEAATLMERLHPQDWSQLATKDDLAGLRTELRSEISGLRTEVRSEIAEVRSEIGAVRSEVHHLSDRVDLKMESLESRLSGQISDFKSEVHQALRDQFSRTVMLLVPSMFSAVGLAFAAAKFS